MGIGIVVTMVLSFVGEAALADGFSSRNRKSLFSSQTKILDNRASKQYSDSVRLKPANVTTPSKWADETSPRFSGKYKGKFLPVARAAARRHGIPEDLFLRLIQQESNWNPTAKSHAGAYGLAQLIPSTARYLGVDVRDPYQRLRWWCALSKEQYSCVWIMAFGVGCLQRRAGCGQKIWWRSTIQRDAQLCKSDLG